MKKNIVLPLLLILSVTTFSQQTLNNDSPTTKADYLQKSKRQKKVARIMLGGGASFTVLGLHLKQYIGAGVIIAGIGVLSVLGSVPMFIASSKNRLRAMSLSFKNEPVTLFQKSNFVYRSVPSITLKISL